MEDAKTLDRTKRGAVALAIGSIALALTLALTGCAGGGAAGGEVAPEDRTNAKQVIMGAGDLFTMMDLGLTDADSPATISQDDPRFAEFWDELLQYRKVADLDVSNGEIVAEITAVEAATAREDSAQTNYRYAIKSASMTVNGTPITYDASKGFSS